MAKPKRLTRDELLARKRATEKARRDKIKLNPEEYARYKEKEKQRYKKRKEEKKLLNINDLTPREQRNQRRKWKLNSKNFREKQKKAKELQIKLAESTPPDSDSDEPQQQNILPEQVQPNTSSAHHNSSSAHPTPVASPSVAQKRPFTRSHGQMSANFDMPSTSTQSDSPKSDVSSLKRRLRYKVSRKLLFYKQQLNALKKQNDTLRKRLFRDKNKLKNRYSESPRTKAENLLSDPNKKEDVKKALVFAEVIKGDFKTTYENLKTHKEKKCFKENIKPACNTLKNYKMLNTVQRKMARKVNLREKINETKFKVQEDIRLFFERDDNTRLAAGKKECITRKKEKKQKRYLQDTLKNLYSKFLDTHQYTISYSLFCYNKPFWVVTPTEKNLETCMCKLHENITLLAQSLWKNKIILEKSSSEVLSSTVCSVHEMDCLERKCPICVNKVPIILEFDNSLEIRYWMWQSGSKEVNTKTGTKIIKITEKKELRGSPKAVIGLLLRDLEKFYIHCANIANQYEYTTTVKNQLETNEAVIHMDFSENYSTKYNTEIQSMHFGGSRTQISLHTSVIYIPDLGPKSFCTYSDCLRHDAFGVWGHIIPILKYIENIAPNTDTLHIITDSTCSQYRNKTIYYMITKLHWYIKYLKCITWNYTEAGHGKGAPDGVGATLKRTADQIVRYGRDITDIDTFSNEMKKAIKNVVLEYVSEYDIYEKEYFIPSILLKPFKGTMQVHQIVWDKNSEDSIVLRKQSCISDICRNRAVKCVHGKHLGYYGTPKLGHLVSSQREKPIVISDITLTGPKKQLLPATVNSPNKSESGTSHLNHDSEFNENRAEALIKDFIPSALGSLYSSSLFTINNPKSLSVLATLACMDILHSNYESLYCIGDSVLVRYYQRKKWTYYVGNVTALKLQNNETTFSIVFYKTIKRPELKFVTTKRVDWDEVTQISIVKKLKLKVNPKNLKEFILSNDDDKLYFF